MIATVHDALVYVDALCLVVFVIFAYLLVKR